MQIIIRLYFDTLLLNFMPLNFDDFKKQDISFDISELRNACDEVLKIKGFDTSSGDIFDFYQVKKKS